MTRSWQDLRQQYPHFSYLSSSWKQGEEGLEVDYHFSIEGLADFRPRLLFPLPATGLEGVDTRVLDRLVFYQGMVELISYWKASCSPYVSIQAGSLRPEEIPFWRELYWGGLGEFFYRNEIQLTREDFLAFRYEKKEERESYSPRSLDEDAVLIPVGGGKDSILTLEWLRPMRRVAYAINPTVPVRASIEVAGVKEGLFVRRGIDPILLDLNRQGFLNGHTPFSATVAFTSMLTAYLHGIPYIALSNENSADEASVAGTEINHQYSKSSAFEQAFTAYIEEELQLGISYFSFLRPLTELAIARHFSSFTKYHEIFRSCNLGARENRWCGHCPKCLFVSILLAPFLGIAEVERLLNTAIFSNPDLLTTLDELLGLEKSKPFDCVGTVEEVHLAMALSLRKEKGELPLLLNHFLQHLCNGHIPHYSMKEHEVQIPYHLYDKTLRCYYNKNGVPKRFLPFFPSQYNDWVDFQLPGEEKKIRWQGREDFSYATALRKQLREEAPNLLLLGYGREGRALLQILSEELQPCRRRNLGIADARPLSTELPLPVQQQIGESYLRAMSNYAKVYKSPGIVLKDFEKRDEAHLQAFPQAEMSSQAELFLRHFGRQCIGVTGTKGKSTTTSLVHAVLKTATGQAGIRGEAFLLGNIGTAPLTALHELSDEARIALELSCHQLEYCRYSPHIGLLTNLYPEHLDHYPSYEDYVRAKLNLLRYQGPEDVAILNADQKEYISLYQANVRSQVIWVSQAENPSEAERPTQERGDGWVRLLKEKKQDLRLIYEISGQRGEWNLQELPLSLSSPHHAYDYAQAAAACHVAGYPDEVIEKGLMSFHGLPHRCEAIGKYRGISFYNDSISTIPETCLVALETLGRVDTLILGGLDRGISYDILVSELATGRVPHLICLPETGYKIAERLRKKDLPSVEIRCVETMEEAVACAYQMTPSPGVCLLSPAAASYHRYRDFEARGEDFRQEVLQQA